MNYAISRKADTHSDYCEDSHFILEHEHSIIFGAFDGCSTGINSHFASALLSKCVSNSFVAVDHKLGGAINHPDMPLTGKLFNSMISEACCNFQSLTNLLHMDPMEQLSTAVIGVFGKKNKTLLVKMLGDGNIWVEFNDGSAEYTTRHFPGNAPDYLGYHTNGSNYHVGEWVHIQPLEKFDDVKAFSIGTDGVESIRPVSGLITQEDAIDFLVHDLTLKPSKAMLARKLNILKNTKGCAFDDDITILRYIPD